MGGVLLLVAGLVVLVLIVNPVLRAKRDREDREHDQ